MVCSIPPPRASPAPREAQHPGTPRGAPGAVSGGQSEQRTHLAHAPSRPSAITGFPSLAPPCRGCAGPCAPAGASFRCSRRRLCEPTSSHMSLSHELTVAGHKPACAPRDVDAPHAASPYACTVQLTARA